MLEGDVITIQAIGTTPVLGTVHHQFVIKLIREAGDTYRQPQTRISRFVGRIEVLGVEVVNKGQSFGIGTERIDEVLAGFVEITTSIGDALNTRHHQTI